MASNWPSWFWGQGRSGCYFYSPPAEYGKDFCMPNGQDVPALWGGKVVQAERTCWNADCTSTSGGIVSIEANVPGLGDIITYYMHFESIDVRVGDMVQPGTILGKSGGFSTSSPWPTDSSHGNTPHMEIGFNAPWLPVKKGPNVDPLNYIDAALGTPYNPSKPSGSSGSGSHSSVPIIGPIIDWLNQQKDALGAWFGQFKVMFDWVTHPIRIVKMVTGVLMLLAAIYLLISPSAHKQAVIFYKNAIKLAEV